MSGAFVASAPPAADGYSTVNLWLNNQPIEVCNVESRISLSLFYRPSAGAWSGATCSGAINGWNAETGSLGLDSSGNFDGATALATGSAAPLPPRSTCSPTIPSRRSRALGDTTL